MTTGPGAPGTAATPPDLEPPVGQPHHDAAAGSAGDVATDRAAAGSGRLLAGRYRVTADGEPRRLELVPGHDELLDRPVTLLLVRGHVPVEQRLRVRRQLRRLADVRHEHLAEALDVVDHPQGCAVVLPAMPGARLLSTALEHPDPALPAVALHAAVSDVGAALTFLATQGCHHGAVGVDAVAITRDRRGMLLPLPTAPGGGAAPDLHDLEATRRLLPPPAGGSLVTVRSARGHRSTGRPGADDGDVRRGRRRGAAPRRGLLVLAGGLGGALLADLAQRLAT